MGVRRIGDVRQHHLQLSGHRCGNAIDDSLQNLPEVLFYATAMSQQDRTRPSLPVVAGNTELQTVQLQFEDPAVLAHLTAASISHLCNRLRDFGVQVLTQARAIEHAEPCG